MLPGKSREMTVYLLKVSLNSIALTLKVDSRVRKLQEMEVIRRG